MVADGTYRTCYPVARRRSSRVCEPHDSKHPRSRQGVEACSRCTDEGVDHLHRCQMRWPLFRRDDVLVKVRLSAVLAAMVAVVGLVVWGLDRPQGMSRPPATNASVPAVVPSAVASSSGSASVPPFQGSPPGGSKWRLRFSSDFSGSHLNSRVWATCYPWANKSTGCTNFGNTEYQWYMPTQVRMSGGVLHLDARPVPTLGLNAKGNSKKYQCRSGMVTTYPGFRFEYGYIQVVARVPDGPGLWPALWLAAANLRWPPEMDLLEHWGHNVRTGVYFHPIGVRGITQHLRVANLASRWHTFSLSWTPSKLVWFIDGSAVLTADRDIPHQAMYFIADLAEYLAAGGQRCEGTFLIRSIKVWQR